MYRDKSDWSFFGFVSLCKVIVRFIREWNRLGYELG